MLQQSGYVLNKDDYPPKSLAKLPLQTSQPIATMALKSKRDVAHYVLSLQPGIKFHNIAKGLDLEPMFLFKELQKIEDATLQQILNSKLLKYSIATVRSKIAEATTHMQTGAILCRVADRIKIPTIILKRWLTIKDELDKYTEITEILPKENPKIPFSAKVELAHLLLLNHEWLSLTRISLIIVIKLPKLRASLEKLALEKLALEKPDTTLQVILRTRCRTFKRTHR